MEHRWRGRLVLADDHTLVAQACKSFLEPEFEVVAVAKDGRAMLKAASELKPDAVILDIAMPFLNGLDAGERLRRVLRNVKIIYLTMHSEPEVVAEAFQRGASAYVLKSSAAEELILALRAALRGESYISPLITKDTFAFLLTSGATRRCEKRITSRQTEVLQLLAEGKSMKEAANILNLKQGTVAFHKYKIMESLGLQTNSDLVRYALEHHMIG